MVEFDLIWAFKNSEESNAFSCLSRRKLLKWVRLSVSQPQTKWVGTLWAVWIHARGLDIIVKLFFLFFSSFFDVPRRYHLCYLCLVFVMLSRLLIAALWSPEGKGLTSWLVFVLFIVILLLSDLVFWDSVVLDCIDSWSLLSFLLWTMSWFASQMQCVGTICERLLQFYSDLIELCIHLIWKLSLL